MVADPYYYFDPTDYAIANGTWYDSNGIDPDGYDRDGVYIGEEYYDPEAEEDEAYWNEVDAQVDEMLLERDGL